MTYASALLACLCLHADVGMFMVARIRRHAYVCMHAFDYLCLHAYIGLFMLACTRGPAYSLAIVLMSECKDSGEP